MSAKAKLGRSQFRSINRSLRQGGAESNHITSITTQLEERRRGRKEGGGGGSMRYTTFDWIGER